MKPYGYKINNVDSSITHWWCATPTLFGNNSDMNFVYSKLGDELDIDKAEKLAYEYGFVFELLYEDDWNKIEKPLTTLWKRIFKK